MYRAQQIWQFGHVFRNNKGLSNLSTHAHLHTYIHSIIHTYIHTYIRTYMHSMHTYIACIHTYIHTYIHTHIRIVKKIHSLFYILVIVSKGTSLHIIRSLQLLDCNGIGKHTVSYLKLTVRLHSCCSKD